MTSYSFTLFSIYKIPKIINPILPVQATFFSFTYLERTGPFASFSFAPAITGVLVFTPVSDSVSAVLLCIRYLCYLKYLFAFRPEVEPV